MRRLMLLAFVVAAALGAGCLGVTAAEIPEDERNAKNWQETSSERQTVAFGMAELVTKEYGPNNDVGVTGATVATAPDVPIYDETNLLPRALEQVEQKRNIELTQSGTTTLSLSNLGADTDADVYRFEKNGAQGKLVLFDAPSCDAFVVVAGYGITDPAGISDETTYGEARDLARTVAC